MGRSKGFPGKGGGGLRSAIFRNFLQFRYFSQFSTFLRNFPLFSAIFSQSLCVLIGALRLCEQLLQNNILQCFLAPKNSELCFNFMIRLRAACRRNTDTCGRFDLFQYSEALVQNSCSLRLR